MRKEIRELTCDECGKKTQEDPRVLDKMPFAEWYVLTKNCYNAGSKWPLDFCSMDCVSGYAQGALCE